MKSGYLKVVTPEGVTLRFPLAGLASRFLAWLVDASVVFAAAGVMQRFTNLAAIFGEQWRAAFAILSYFVLSVGYALLLEWIWRGQTVGKRLLHLRVMDVHALRLTFPQIAIRNLLRFVDALPVSYLAGGITTFFNRHGQRLGDIAANTVVIRLVPINAPKLPEAEEIVFNSFRAYAHLVARVQQKATPELMELTIEALNRRNGFDAHGRVALFSMIRTRYESMVEFPEETTFAFSDEQYVRGLMAALLARQSGGKRRKP